MDKNRQRLIITEPSPNDVLFGRGKSIQNHPGNVRLRSIVETYNFEYTNSTKSRKTEISNEIVNKIKTGNYGDNNNSNNNNTIGPGRFLKSNNDSSAGLKYQRMKHV